MDLDLVDQRRIQEGLRKSHPRLSQDRQDSDVEQRRHSGLQVETVGHLLQRDGDDVDTSLGEPHPVSRRARSHEQHTPLSHDGRVFRDVAGGRQDHRTRLSMRRHMTYVEHRVVHTDGISADEYRVGCRTERMDPPSRCVTRQVAALLWNGHSIDRLGDLERDVRSGECDGSEEATEIVFSQSSQGMALGTDLSDADSCVPKCTCPASRRRMWILEEVVHARDTGTNQCICTGRSSTVVRARLERNDGCRPSSLGTGRFEGDDLGMTPPDRLGRSFSDDISITDKDATNGRIRPRCSCSSTTDFKRPKVDRITQEDCVPRLRCLVRHHKPPEHCETGGPMECFPYLSVRASVRQGYRPRPRGNGRTGVPSTVSKRSFRALLQVFDGLDLVRCIEDRTSGYEPIGACLSGVNDGLSVDSPIDLDPVLQP